MSSSPLKADTDLVSVNILIDGTEMNNAYNVMSVEVTRIVYRIAKARFTLLLLPDESEGKTFKLSESQEFVPGNKVEIKAGYNLKTKTIFKGVITGQGLQVKGRDQIILEVSCQDEALKMTGNRQSQYFKDKKDSDILTTLINNHGLEKKVSSTTLSHDTMVQYQVSDWDFAVMRAQANGLLLNTQDGKVIIEPPTSSGTGVLTLTYGLDVYEFQVHIDASHQIPSVTAAAWNNATQKLEEEKSSEPSIASIGNLKGKKIAQEIGFKDRQIHLDSNLAKSELKDWANANLVKSRLAMIQGKISFVGNDKPEINKLIELSGFGKRFNGNALITGVEHDIQEGKWVTTVYLGVDAEWFHERSSISNPLAGGLLPSIGGLHIGIVKKIHEDPDSVFRVLVNIPNIDTGKQEVWARLSNLYATKGKGIFFYPEISDEVIIGFIDNDPRSAIILGKLYSKKNNPAYTPDEKNRFKAIVSKSDLKIEFDDEDKILSLLTPQKQEIVLSDKDKNLIIKDANGNVIKLSSDGIDLSSKKDINLSATGKIILDAKQNIEVKSAGGDVSLQGLNVKAKANMAFEASGAATAKVNSSGQMIIQGAMVMIN